MSASRTAWLLSLLVAVSGLGCMSPAEEEDGADDQGANVTGGTSAIESPVVFFFDAADKNPRCTGAMLSNKIAVTAKACAKEGLLLGRAQDEAGRGERAKVKKVHVPPVADADIAVVELDKEIEGANAVITHIPLRADYAVNSFAAKKGGLPLIGVKEGEGSTVKGSLVEESAFHSTIIPDKGSEICTADMGAPVCSSTSLKVPFVNYKLEGTCGLSGLIISGADTAPGAVDPKAPNKCSGTSWKVAQLGRYAEFLRQYAPEAFQPYTTNNAILKKIPLVNRRKIAPEGLWGYETRGEIAACKIETPSIASVKPKTATPALQARVKFAAMQKKAAAFGRFGIAPKADPKNVRWLPAKALGPTTGEAFEVKFEGVVDAAIAGDFLVSFRASANGGETWTECDLDGIENGYQIDKTLPLTVADNPSNPSNPNPGTPGTTPQDTPPSNESGYSDPPSTGNDSPSESDGDNDNGTDDSADEAPVAKKKKNASEGCSVSGPVPFSSSSFAPVVGALLGLAALKRRRRR